MLVEQLAAIDALPPALTGGTPFAMELTVLDALHDGFGGAVYFATEVYLRLPNTPPDVLDAARRVRAAFIPELGELGASYSVEAHRAAERRPLLASMKADLDKLPIAGDKTLFDVVTAFLDAGDKIHHELSKRADVPKGARKEAAVIRSTTVGVLSRLRSDVTREIKKNPALPKDLEQRIFGYLDTLEAMSDARGTKRDDAPSTDVAKPEAPPPAAPKPDP